MFSEFLMCHLSDEDICLLVIFSRVFDFIFVVKKMRTFSCDYCQSVALCALVSRKFNMKIKRHVISTLNFTRKAVT